MDEESVPPLEKLLDEVRDIDGFPKAKDEDILELSDPPYFTACLNPYIEEFIKKHGKHYDPNNDNYEKKPFVSDVSEGKGNSIYNVHTFHTKVPHKAIMEFIKHYTEPGDIVFDGFCGTGMTGIAAQLTNRKAILSDLSPVTTFIANNYNRAKNLGEFKEKAEDILSSFEEELEWMYRTPHDYSNKKQSKIEGKKDAKGTINYTVWSEVIKCPYCKNTFTKYLPSTKDNSILKEVESCPNCESKVSNDFDRVEDDVYDPNLDKRMKQVLQEPLFLDYEFAEENFKKQIEDEDLELIEKIEEKEIPYWYPIDKLPKGKNTRQPINSHNYTHVHHFYTKRNLWSSAYLFDKIERCEEKNLKNLLKFWFTSVCLGQTKLNRYFEKSYSQVNRYLKGKLYVSGKISEVNPSYSFSGKINRISKSLNFEKNPTTISTNSATNLENIPDKSIDYIFTDPPYGGNIMYSEINYIWESWLKVKTDETKEAIVNKYQNKNVDEYTELMTNSLKEFYRILKPNRWITLVFHNSKAKIWNSISEALTRSGFIVAQVTTMDRKQETFKQMTAPGAVKNDLIINAYKPKKEFGGRFLEKAGEEMEVDFVNQQLKHLPVRPNIERTEKMLYSKMLAHYVENGFKIKYDSTSFYELLEDNFVELDGYWFLESQVKDYNEWKSKLSLDEIKEEYKGQQVLFVSDEKSALQWMYNFLKEPKEYSEIYTAYQQVATATEDKVPEIKELLDNNFIFENGKYRRPQTREERKEVQNARERNLEREFNRIVKKIREGSRKIKNVRKEALIHGFTKLYQQEKYGEILEVADGLYKSTLESSGDIMDFVDIARIKTSGEE